MQARNRGKTLGFLKPRLIVLIGAIAAALSLISCPLKAQSNPELVIFHTNDVHGYALPVWAKNGQLTTIGYSLFKAYADSLPAKNKMLLDAGDILSGQPFANTQQGLLVARMLELLKYDAIAVGNHDFDFGAPRLLELAYKYNLNFISANIHRKEDGTPLFPPYIIKDYGGLKVGVFALSTPETFYKTSPGNVSVLALGASGDLTNMARDLTARLRQEGAHLVVALTRLGTTAQNSPNALDIARAAPGLDLIIDGLDYGQATTLQEGNVLIVSAGGYFQNIGQIEVRRGDKENFILSPKLIQAAEASLLPPDPGLDALGATLQAELERDLNQVAATLPFALEGSAKVNQAFSTNFGRMICAALKRATGADAAIINSGSIAASLPAGEVTRRQLLEAIPYGQRALTVQLSGAELIEIVNQGLSRAGEGGFPQFYGMTVTAIELKNKESAQGDTASTGGRVDIIEIGGRPVAPEASYTIATNDFMYAGGDGYQIFSRRRAQEYATVEEIFQNFLFETSRETLDFINLDDVLTVLVEE